MDRAQIRIEDGKALPVFHFALDQHNRTERSRSETAHKLRAWRITCRIGRIAPGYYRVYSPTGSPVAVIETR